MAPSSFHEALAIRVKTMGTSLIKTSSMVREKLEINDKRGRH